MNNRLIDFLSIAWPREFAPFPLVFNGVDDDTLNHHFNQNDDG